MSVYAVVIRTTRILIRSAIAARVDQFLFLLPLALRPLGPCARLPAAFVGSGFCACVFFCVGCEAAWFAFVHATNTALSVPERLFRTT